MAPANSTSGRDLAEYNAKRDFTRTSEPSGQAGARSGGLRFLVQKHDATRLHYDFRLEWNGVLLSWAVTRGPSANPREKRLAVRTEDHPLNYADFEGTIPKREYGGGTVMLWDEGTWLPKGNVAAELEAGNLKVVVQGRRMRGAWALVRMKPRKAEKRENWLLIKERDELATEDADGLTEAHVTSIRTGRTMPEIAAGTKAKALPLPHPGKPPAFRKVQLATLHAEPPEGDDWIHETKFDGYRCLASLGKGGTRLFTRNGHDWTDRFAALSGAFDTLPCKSALIDGEVMAAHVGPSAFSSLQDAIEAGSSLVLYAFDLLSLNGKDLTGLAQIERRKRLAALMEGQPKDGALRMSDHVQGHGAEVFAAAAAAGAEGIISKRIDAPYRGERTDAWRKIKCTRRQEFIVGGLSPSDKRGRLFSSLLVGETGPDGLRYRGRIGTGFSDADFARLAAEISPRKTSPFTAVPAAIARTAKWVTPHVVIEVEFGEFTADGHIRHGRFLGIREDKAAANVTLEMPQSDSPVVAGIPISNSDRRVFGAAPFTKLDVARHYDRVGERLVQIAGHRPLSLLRCPRGIDGEVFFQKHAHDTMPALLRRIALKDSSGGSADYMYATRPAAFVAAAQMGTIEFHIQGVRTDAPERPDRLVFDLDPDEGLDWPDVRRAATYLRGWLADLGLETGAMVTGGKGIHVWAPLRRTASWDAVRGFTQTVAHVLASKDPTRFTASMSKARRKGRIFIDWLRNERGATAVSPYSLRARPGAPVAVPVTWEELANLKSAAAFTLDTVATRLDEPCPYLAQFGRLQSLNHSTAERLQDWIDSSFS
ncbi:DNA ligase D [Loktanella sp. M215]|uniref:DNA ligase D n=1 Tax=Loktanella sp. M215 TaxID=2675431 RepID=UPI001F0022A6|nr:DNA ligase D [Loktanella sp. M215]